MYDGQADAYHDDLAIYEIQSLRRRAGGKVDHPDGGSKDLADAVAAAVYGALEAGGAGEGDEARASGQGGRGLLHAGAREDRQPAPRGLHARHRARRPVADRVVSYDASHRSTGPPHRWWRCWVLLIIPTIIWWKDSILWVAFMSLYAIVTGHWGAYEAAKAKDLAEKAVEDVEGSRF